MSKQLIGFFRIITFMMIVSVFNPPLYGTELRMFISDVIYGVHDEVHRNSTAVFAISLIFLTVISFYIIQSLVYLFIGNALEGKDTGIIRFFRLCISGLQDAANDKNFWSQKGSSKDLSNIQRVLSYRDNKIAFMSNSQAAEYMKGTGHVDFMISNKDLPQSQKTLSYLNNKIAFMDNESALQFLKGDKK